MAGLDLLGEITLVHQFVLSVIQSVTQHGIAAGFQGGDFPSDEAVRGGRILIGQIGHPYPRSISMGARVHLIDLDRRRDRGRRRPGQKLPLCLRDSMLTLHRIPLSSVTCRQALSAIAETCRPASDHVVGAGAIDQRRTVGVGPDRPDAPDEERVRAVVEAIDHITVEHRDGIGQDRRSCHQNGPIAVREALDAMALRAPCEAIGENAVFRRRHVHAEASGLKDGAVAVRRLVDADHKTWRLDGERAERRDGEPPPLFSPSRRDDANGGS